MSTLRFDLNFGDWIMDKLDKSKLYFVVVPRLHDVVVYKEGEEDIVELPKRMINLAYMKVDPKTVKVLYGESGIEFEHDSDDASSDS